MTGLRLFKFKPKPIILTPHYKHYPLKKPPKRKLRTKSKLWITPALPNSIKLKIKLYKQFCKTTNPERRKYLLNESFRKYRNIIITLTRIFKENYYKSFFENNKKILKNIGLNIDNETITDELNISNHFNNFFTTVAKNL